MEKWQQSVTDAIARAEKFYPALALTTAERATRQADIDFLKNRLHEAIEHGRPIDLKAMQMLFDLRAEREKDLIEWRSARIDEMRQRTKEWRQKIPPKDPSLYRLHADLMDRIEHEEYKYDESSIRWAHDEISPWIDSEPATIAAGILILFNEIC